MGENSPLTPPQIPHAIAEEVEGNLGSIGSGQPQQEQNFGSLIIGEQIGSDNSKSGIGELSLLPTTHLKDDHCTNTIKDGLENKDGLFVNESDADIIELKDKTDFSSGVTDSQAQKFFLLYLIFLCILYVYILYI